MKNQNLSFNYHDYRMKNIKPKSPVIKNDIKEIDQLSKKLDAFNFNKKMMRNSLKTSQKLHFQIVKEEEGEHLQRQIQFSREKPQLLRNRVKNNKGSDYVQFEIPLECIDNDQHEQGTLGTCFSSKKKIPMIYTDRPSTNRNDEGNQMLQKSIMESTSNSLNQLYGDTYDRSALLAKINEVYGKIEKRMIPAEQIPEIMTLLDKINYILDNE